MIQNFRATDNTRKRIMYVGTRHKYVGIQKTGNKTLYSREVAHLIIRAVKRKRNEFLNPCPCNWSTMGRTLDPKFQQ
jgi:hypothetical protein